MNNFNVRDIIMERQMNFYIQVYNHSTEFINSYLKNALLSHSSYTITNVNMCVNKYNIVFADLFKLNKGQIKEKIKNTYPPMDWRAGMVVELLQALDDTLNVELTTNEIRFLLNEICILN